MFNDDKGTMSWFTKGMIAVGIVFLMLFAIGQAPAQQKVCYTPDQLIEYIDTDVLEYVWTDNKNEMREYQELLENVLGPPPWRIDDATSLVFFWRKDKQSARIAWFGGEDCNITRAANISKKILPEYIKIMRSYNTEANNG